MGDGTMAIGLDEPTSRNSRSAVHVLSELTLGSCEVLHYEPCTWEGSKYTWSRTPSPPNLDTLPNIFTLCERRLASGIVTLSLDYSVIFISVDRRSRRIPRQTSTQLISQTFIVQITTIAEKLTNLLVSSAVAALAKSGPLLG